MHAPRAAPALLRLNVDVRLVRAASKASGSGRPSKLTMTVAGAAVAVAKGGGRSVMGRECDARLVLVGGVGSASQASLVLLVSMISECVLN